MAVLIQARGDDAFIHVGKITSILPTIKRALSGRAMAVGERGIFPITFPRQRLGGFHSLLRCSHTKGPTLLTNPVVAVPPAPHMSACLPSSVRFSTRRHARQREGSPRRHEKRLEAKARGPETDPRCQACGYNRGNRISKLWAGNRSETGPFGVADASSPSFTRSFNTRRVAALGEPCNPRRLAAVDFAAHERLFE